MSCQSAPGYAPGTLFRGGSAPPLLSSHWLTSCDSQ
ncbi:unnamed protein product, partial [Staurois parvus]